MAAKRIVIGPQSGAQTQFLSSPADICIFNSQPGAGKTSCIALDFLRATHLPLFRGAVFRRDSNQLVGGGSVFDLAGRWWPHAGATMISGGQKHARFPAGATVEFHHLHHEKDKEAHDGKSYEILAFDELAHFTESQFWYMTSRNRGVSGFRPCIRASTMASPDSWLHRFVLPWLDKDGGWPDWAQSGRIRWMVRNPFDDQIIWFDNRASAATYCEMVSSNMRLEQVKPRPRSVAVVHALTSSNTTLTDGYDLSAMTAYEREAKAGNWNARPPSSGMFDRKNFKVLDTSPRDEDIVFSVRGWDRAARPVSESTDDPDWTRGVRLDLLRTGQVVISNIVSLRDRPGQATALMKSAMALDGPHVTHACWINPGDSGIYEQESLEAIFKDVVGGGPVVFLRQAANKEAYARPVATFFDPAIRGAQLGAVVRATWNAEFFAELDMFPLKKHPVTGDDLHDDMVDAMSRAFIEIENRRKRSSSSLDAWAEVPMSTIRPY